MNDIRQISREELNEILKEHELWLKGEGEGERADLSYTNLSGMDLKGVNLKRAILTHTDLVYADLKYANLAYADLRYADLRCADAENVDFMSADLKYAKLSDANLKRANFKYADSRFADFKYADLRYACAISTGFEGADFESAILRYANLKHADLEGVNLKYADISYARLSGALMKNIKVNISTTGYALACPEKGSFVGYKKAGKCIVELLILDDAKRVSATTTRCRADKARVLEIRDIETNALVDEVCSDYDSKFIYKTGEIICVKDFDNDRWSTFTTGIHFFMSKDEAMDY